MAHDNGSRSGGVAAYLRAWTAALAGLPAARAILEECGYTEGETGEILQAVASHSGNRGNVFPMNLEELLYYADKAGRCCYHCEAKRDCYWTEDRKNDSLVF